ncbi:MAG: amidase [Acidimicrobiales bacterium]|nr:amidase [Acidimicrobiales bacterium]
MTDSVFDDHDALGLAALVREGEVSASELLDEAIDRVEATDAELNVLADRYFDFAREAIAAGLPDGPFTGVPFLRKDNGAEIAGLSSTSGTRLLADNTAVETSVLGQRFLDAGLVPFGATAVPPLCVNIDSDRAPYGACLNPWDLTRTPGGSSSGAAAVVGAGALPMTHGNDGGGSLRIPAAWSGAFTVKPSRGRVPSGPIYTEGWMGFAVEGVITRSVRDCAAAMDAISGREVGVRYDAPSPARPYADEVTGECRPLRIAVLEATHSGEPFHPHHAQATRDTADLLIGLGHQVEAASPPVDTGRIVAELFKTVAVDVANLLDDVAQERGVPVTDDELEASVATFRRQGNIVAGKEYARVNEVSMETAYALDEFMQNYDLILSPTMPGPPPPIGEVYRHENDAEALARHLDEFINMTMVQNVSGQPAASVPLWWSPDGLPIGMMFSARYGDESTLFSISGQLEQARPWWDKRPKRNDI